MDSPGRKVLAVASSRSQLRRGQNSSDQQLRPSRRREVVVSAAFGGHRARRLGSRIRKAWDRGLVMSLDNAIDAYWWTGRRNFGDLLTPALLRSYGCIPVLADPSTCHLVAVGSILHHVPGDFGGLVLGSGAISGSDRISLPNAQILALRGELTRSVLGYEAPVPLGDPGLLSERLSGPCTEKRYEIGIVPHFMDSNDERLTEVKSRLGNAVAVIDVSRKPVDVINDIKVCRYVLSSSLHGLVVAEAYGIPTGWLELSDRVIGGGFKFADYYSALATTREPQSISGTESLGQLRELARPTSPNIHAVQQQLHQQFVKLRSALHRPGLP